MQQNKDIEKKALQKIRKPFQKMPSQNRYAIYVYHKPILGSKRLERWERVNETCCPRSAVKRAHALIRSDYYDRVEIKKLEFFFGKKKRSEETFRIYNRARKKFPQIIKKLIKYG